MLLRLSAAHGISDNIVQPLTFTLRHISVSIEFWVGGLIWILNIYNNLPQPAINPPDGSRSHTSLIHGPGLQNRFRNFLDCRFKLRNGGIIPLDINDIQGVGFLSNLVQIIADTVELLHHGIVVRGWCILRNNAVDEMAHIGCGREAGMRCSFLYMISKLVPVVLARLMVVTTISGGVQRRWMISLT